MDERNHLLKKGMNGIKAKSAAVKKPHHFDAAKQFHKTNQQNDAAFKKQHYRT